MGKRKVAAEVVSFCLGDLHAAGYNPRVISDEAYAALARSIEKFGCVEPIIVNVRGGKNVIVGGHQRYKVLCDAGVKECLCVTVDLSDDDEKLLNLTLNNPAAQGEFIEELDKYIDSIRDQLDGDDYLGLRIDALRGELKENEGLTDDDDGADRKAVCTRRCSR